MLTDAAGEVTVVVPLGRVGTFVPILVEKRHPAPSDVKVSAVLAASAVLDDARDPRGYGVARLRGAVNVSADARMAVTVGTVIDLAHMAVVLADDGQEKEIAMCFARIGFDHILSHATDGIWFLLHHAHELEPASSLTAAQVEQALMSGGVHLVEIRNDREVANGIISGGLVISLLEPTRRPDEIDPAGPGMDYFYCASGWPGGRGHQPGAVKGLHQCVGRPRRHRSLRPTAYDGGRFLSTRPGMAA